MREARIHFLWDLFPRGLQNMVRTAVGIAMHMGIHHIKKYVKVLISRKHL
jgi:hypothetical protein